MAIFSVLAVMQALAIVSPSSEGQFDCSNIHCDVLIGGPHQLQQQSFTALLPQAIFMFLWIWLLFIHEAYMYTLSSLFLNYHVKKNLFVFKSHNFGQISWTIHWKLRLKKPYVGVKFDLLKLFQFVNYCRLWTDYLNGLRSIRHHNKLATTQSQIATGGDLTLTLCLAMLISWRLWSVCEQQNQSDIRRVISAKWSRVIKDCN